MRVDTSSYSTGALESVCARRENHEFFYKYTSFNDPGTVYRAELKEVAATTTEAAKAAAGEATAAAPAGGDGKKKKNNKKKDSTTTTTTTAIEIPTSLLFRSDIPGLNPDEYTTSQVSTFSVVYVHTY